MFSVLSAWQLLVRRPLRGRPDVSTSSISLSELIGLFGVVTSGVILPFVPTGAAVSVAAALAGAADVPGLLLVVAFGAAGAYVADLLTYAALTATEDRAGEGTGRLARLVGRLRTGRATTRVRGQLDHHELRTLLLSRLVPGGQLPVLVTAALGRYPLRRFAAADLLAATLWSGVYAIIGIAGRAVFPEPWEGAATGIVVVLTVSVLSGLWSRRGRSTSKP